MSATLDAQRRLHLPKPLGLSTPLLLIEMGEEGEAHLGISNAVAVQTMRLKGLAPKVLRECSSLRPSIPSEVCARHLIAPRSKVWLLVMDYWISIKSEVVWQAEFDAIQPTMAFAPS